MLGFQGVCMLNFHWHVWHSWYLSPPINQSRSLRFMAQPLTWLRSMVFWIRRTENTPRSWKFAHQKQEQDAVDAVGVHFFDIFQILDAMLCHCFDTYIYTRKWYMLLMCYYASGSLSIHVRAKLHVVRAWPIHSLYFFITCFMNFPLKWFIMIPVLVFVSHCLGEQPQALDLTFFWWVRPMPRRYEACPCRRASLWRSA